VLLAVAGPDGGWERPLAALGDWVKAHIGNGGKAEVIVSDRWARFAVMPWSAVVMNAAEETALARACIESTTGALDGWHVALGPAHYGRGRAVCALESALVERLSGIFAPVGVRCVGIHPYFSLAAERGQAVQSGDGGIFAVAESDCVVLASAQNGDWNSIRAVKGSMGAEGLAQVVEREWLLQGFGARPTIVLASPGLTHDEVMKSDGTSLSAEGMLKEAERSKLVPLDFSPAQTQRKRRLGAALLALSVVFTGASAWYYTKVQREESDSELTLIAARDAQARMKQAVDPEAQGQRLVELRAANRIIEQLNTPWDQLFAAVEEFYDEQVTLLSVEPDPERSEVRLVAEAKDLAAMLRYLKQVRASAVLSDGYLVEHAINPQDPQRPVRFTIVARWTGGGKPTRNGGAGL
jgi:hypothetical protein